MRHPHTFTEFVKANGLKRVGPMVKGLFGGNRSSVDEDSDLEVRSENPARLEDRKLENGNEN